MKVAPREVERLLSAPPPGLRAVLLHGPDNGLVRERARALVTSVAVDPKDPFRVADLTLAEIKSAPARLADEAAALSFTGGRRAVRVREGEDALMPAVKLLLAGAETDSLVVIEAGELSARSALRRLFEAERGLAALACYRDDARALPGVIKEALRAAGLTASADALAYLAAHLGGDRQVTRRELEKLVLYKDAAPDAVPDGAPRRLELEDAQACIGDTAEISLDDLVHDLGDGQIPAMERALARSLQEGANPVAVLRAVARHLQRLHLVAGLVSQGTALEAAMKRLRPPPFWKLAPRFRTQAQAWRPEVLRRALARVLEAERACKRSGAPAELLCGAALHAIARAAPKTGRAAPRGDWES